MIYSTVNHQELPFSDATHLFDGGVLEWSLFCLIACPRLFDFITFDPRPNSIYPPCFRPGKVPGRETEVTGHRGPRTGHRRSRDQKVPGLNKSWDLETPKVLGHENGKKSQEMPKLLFSHFTVELELAKETLCRTKEKLKHNKLRYLKVISYHP